MPFCPTPLPHTLECECMSSCFKHSSRSQRCAHAQNWRRVYDAAQDRDADGLFVRPCQRERVVAPRHRVARAVCASRVCQQREHHPALRELLRLSLSMMAMTGSAAVAHCCCCCCCLTCQQSMPAWGLMLLHCIGVVSLTYSRGCCVDGQAQTVCWLAFVRGGGGVVVSCWLTAAASK